jgi:hypothetical protein
LKKQNINEKYIRIIKKIYDNSEAQIRINNDLGKSFKIKRGIRQGDPLSPKCFTSALETILETLDNSKGLKISENLFLNQLSFADDIVLISDTLEKIYEMIEELDSKASKIGLEISFEKTKILTNIETTQNCFMFKNQSIEIVKSFKYLGEEFSFDKNAIDKEIENRISAAWKSFWSLKKFFKGKLPMYHKKRLFDACVLPTFTYGCQTWSLTENQKEKFQVAQRSMERQLLKIKINDKLTIQK